MKYQCNYIFTILLYLNYCFIRCCDSSFNYEIASRVHDNVAAFFVKVSSASTIPLAMIKGNLANITDFPNSPITIGHILFYAIKNVYYDEITTVQIGFDNKMYFFYQNLKTAPHGYIIGVSFAKKYTTRMFYYVKADGTKDSYYSNATFDCTKRPWYTQGKAANKIIWTSPFLQATNNKPVVSLVTPLHNLTLAGILVPFGGIACNVELSAISSYLKLAYKDTDRDVFIIDKSSGYLIGSSMDALLYSITNNVHNLMMAINSDNVIISGAINILNEKEWPDYLVIYDGYYLQSIPYTDSIPGIEWMIVVLLPAVLEPDHLGPESPLHAISTAISILAIFTAILSLALTLYYWKSRMIQLSQPYFTILVQLGCILLGISGILFLGENNSSNCASRAFIFNSAFTIAFSPLLVKCFRVYLVFVYTWRANVLVHGGQSKIISTGGLFLYTGLFLAADILIIILAVYVGGTGSLPVKSTELSSNGAYAQFTFCSYHNNNYFYYSELAYKGLLILLACYLSVAIRSVSDAIAGSKVLLAIVYNTAFVGGILVALNRTVTNVKVVIFCEILGISYCVILASVLLIAPVLYTIIYIGDKVAAADVIDEMFQNRIANNSKAAATTRSGGIHHPKLTTSHPEEVVFNVKVFSGNSGTPVVPSSPSNQIKTERKNNKLGLNF